MKSTTQDSTMPYSTMPSTGKPQDSSRFSVCLIFSLKGFSKKDKLTSLVPYLAPLLALFIIGLLSSCILPTKQPNTAPSVRIISPQDSEVFITNALRISIEAQDAEKNIKHIKVYENGQEIGEASRSEEQTESQAESENQTQDISLATPENTSPTENWYFNWTAPENGSFTFSAEAIDTLGGKSTASVSFEIQLPSTPNPTNPVDGIALQSYSQNLALWQLQNINSYTIDFQRICFCLPEVTQPVQLSVENNTLSDAIYLNGTAVNQSNYANFYTINKAFSLIQEAFERNAVEVRVVYNQEFGFPSSVFIDYIENIADEELQFNFDNFIAN